MDYQGMGAVLDLPEDVAKELLALQLAPEDCIQVISKVSSNLLLKKTTRVVPRERFIPR